MFDSARAAVRVKTQKDSGSNNDQANKTLVASLLEAVYGREHFWRATDSIDVCENSTPESMPELTVRWHGEHNDIHQL